MIAIQMMRFRQFHGERLFFEQQRSWETDSGEEGSESDPMEEEDFDEESDDGSGSEDIDVRNDDGVDVQNTSRRNTTERGAGLVPIFGSLLDGQLESIVNG